MAVPTIASMCAKLGASLQPVHPVPALELPVKGVHVSDLPDPTPYLRGGELLMTTGLLLPLDDAGVATYVRRLRAIGIAALVFGLGPAHDTVPESLVAASREAGLSLLSVPGPVPFQEISSAYWQELRLDDQRELVDALGAQTELVRAATSEDPALSLLKGLVGRLGGWAAHLWPDGSVRLVWPSESLHRAEAIRPVVTRLLTTRSSPAAAFPVAQDEVVVHGIPSAASGSGLLAAGSTERPTAMQRSLISTTAVLLGLALAQGSAVRDLMRARGSVLAKLLDHGHPELARTLAGELDHTLPAGRARLVAFASAHPGATLDAIESAWSSPRPFVADLDTDSGWCVVPDDDGAADEAVSRLRAATRDDAIIVGAPGPVARVVETARVLLGDARAAKAGAVHLVGGHDGISWERLPRADWLEILQPITDGPSPELLEAVVAYLGNRGSWEAAARQVGVHRNTMRNRIERASHLLGAGKDLDDPDFAAAMWLTLRSLGHA